MTKQQLNQQIKLKLSTAIERRTDAVLSPAECAAVLGWISNRGRKPQGERAMTDAERQRRRYYKGKP